MTERHPAETSRSTSTAEDLERSSLPKAPISEIKAASPSTLSVCPARYLVAACLSDCRANIEVGASDQPRSPGNARVAGLDMGRGWTGSRGEVAYGHEQSGGMMKQWELCSFDDSGVVSVLGTESGPQRHWRRFSGLMSWLEVTRTSAKWWACTGPGNFVAIQVPLVSSDEALFALCIAVDGQTSFRAVFCDPAQCRQSGCPVQATESRFDYEIGEMSRSSMDLCPAGVHQ